MTTIARLRWRIAELINRLPGQCWSDLADYPLGTRRIPWAPISDMCRDDQARCGSCYCGKLSRPESLLPFHVGDGPCPTCSALSGQRHELSCEQVTPEQVRAFLAAQDRINGGAR